MTVFISWNIYTNGLMRQDLPKATGRREKYSSSNLSHFKLELARKMSARYNRFVPIRIRILQRRLVCYHQIFSSLLEAPE